MLAVCVDNAGVGGSLTFQIKMGQTFNVITETQDEHVDCQVLNSSAGMSYDWINHCDVVRHYHIISIIE